MMKEYAKTELQERFFASREKFEKLAEKLGGEKAARLEHAEIEEMIDNDGRAILRQLMQDHLELRACREKRRGEVAGADGNTRTHCRENTRRGLRVIFGDVDVMRMAYSGREMSGLFPLDAELNLPPDTYSHGLERRICEDAVKMSFDAAVESVERTTGVHVPKRQAEELVQKAASDFDTFYEARAAAGAQQSGDLLVLSTDGKGVVVRTCDLREETRKRAEREKQKRRRKRLPPGHKRNRKRMGTVAAVYSVARHVRTAEEVMGVAALPEGVTRLPDRRPRPTDKRVWASLAKEPDLVMDGVFLEALKRDPDKQRCCVFLVDGELEQLARVRDFAELYEVDLTVVCDFIHVLEYLWDAAHCFCPVGSDEAEKWVVQRAIEVLRGNSSEVAGGIRRSATLRGLSRKNRKAADDCARYLTNHREYLRYDEYLAAGYPIATGVIEGACRHLVNDRLGVTGARWSLCGAEAVLKLRALWASGDLEKYWAFRRKAELKRNHLSHYAENPKRSAS